MEACRTCKPWGGERPKRAAENQTKRNRESFSVTIALVRALVRLSGPEVDVLRKCVGTVTIGQTPRDDVVPQLRTILGDQIEIVETGALDGLSEQTIKDGTASSEGALLVTRLRGGLEIHVRQGFLTPRLQQCVTSLQDRVHLILVLCTGDFPPLESDLPVLFPGPLVRNTVRGLGLASVGIMTPNVGQIADQQERWNGVVPRVVVETASPYASPEGLSDAARRLRDARIDAAVMDCVGYTRVMKQTVRTILGKPVLAATSLLARIVAEMLDG